ncbi:response regulator [Pontibacter ramchanderi]|uniref:Response regulator receiver domain-containing protein n=1 Tax=Pontibacter ramchanderi TaxID=1179743 RepID=A0A2N3V2R8_9BACT|nr:response regulator [Pontibacter ramchanderi]PKV75898.1 response regulator receiver domain-containing protein [Pontibacter ramchanderi]
MNKLTNILLVDDDPIANYVNKTLLEKIDGVEQVTTAPNGKVALQLLEQQTSPNNTPDLILLDINMPVMNGIEFMQAYKELAIEGKETIKVIILTTSNHPRDLACFTDLPIAGFLNKPLTSGKISGLLDEHFPA